jgi:hypothetical protein
MVMLGMMKDTQVRAASTPEQRQQNDDRNRNPDHPQKNALAERHARLLQQLAIAKTTLNPAFGSSVGASSYTNCGFRDLTPAQRVPI